MFQHQGAIFTGFTKNKGPYVHHVLQVIVVLTFITRIKSLKMLEL
jgi:hypothetical protein